MPWTENRQLKINFIKGKGSQDHLVIFEVSEEKRQAFFGVFEYFIAAVKTADGFIQDCDDCIDSETRSPISLTVSICGKPEKMMQVMNKYGPELSQHAVGVKQI